MNVSIRWWTKIFTMEKLMFHQTSIKKNSCWGFQVLVVSYQKYDICICLNSGSNNNWCWLASQHTYWNKCSTNMLSEKLKHSKGRQEFSNISHSGSQNLLSCHSLEVADLTPWNCPYKILAHRTSNNEQRMFNHLRNACSNHSQFRWARIPSVLFLFFILLDTILIRGANRWGFQPN